MKLIAILSTLFAVSSALDVRSSFLETVYDGDERETNALIGSTLRCTQQLRVCESGPGGSDLPVAAWSGFLSGLGQTETTGKIQDIISASSDADSTSLFEGLKASSDPDDKLATLGGLAAGVLALKGLSLFASEDETTDSAQVVITTSIQVQEVLAEFENSQILSILSTIIDIIKFALALYMAIQSGPTAVLSFLIAAIIPLITGLIRDSGKMIIMPAGDAECFAKLNNCKFRSFIKSAVPSLIGLAAYGTDEAEP